MNRGVESRVARPKAMRRVHGTPAARSVKALVVFATAAMGIAAAQPAAAQDITNVKSVDIALVGHVTQRCTMGSSSETSDLGNLNRGRGAVNAQFQLDCNVPFSMSIQAQRGAIENLAMPNGQGGYQGSIPYSLNVELPIRRPAREVISKMFEGRSLVGGQTISSMGGIAQDGMLLRLNLGSVTSSAGLLAGQYGETIVITVTPS